MAEIIDLMLPLSAMGPFGGALEVIDDQIIEAVLRTLAKIRTNPEKRKERREARLARKEARRRAKEENK
jgi:hypothetical protein